MSMRVEQGPAQSQMIADPILVELYRYWESKRGSRLFPSRSSIDPSEIKRCLSRMMLVDVFREPLRFRYRLVGTAASSLISLGELTGKWVNRDTYGDFAATLQDMYGRVVETGRPIRGSGNLRDLDGRDWVNVENVQMPLGDSDDLVTMVMVGVAQTRRPSLPDDQGIESWMVASEPLLPG
jgi:hypothetical protein